MLLGIFVELPLAQIRGAKQRREKGDKRKAYFIDTSLAR
jgi:hypothetical protein